jgi:hypothetical protein
MISSPNRLVSAAEAAVDVIDSTMAKVQMTGLIVCIILYIASIHKLSVIQFLDIVLAFRARICSFGPIWRPEAT